MQHTLKSTDDIRALEALALDWPNAALEPVGPENIYALAKEWGRRFWSLGTHLREQGYAGQLRNVTIGRPMDHMAIEVLRLAIRIPPEGENSVEFLRLVELLSNFLSEGPESLLRFQEAMRSVMRRLTAYGF